MPENTPEAERPVALVSGATGGIGGAIAKALAVDHRVIALGRDGGRLAALGRIDGVEPTEIDILDLDAVRHLVESLGRLDVVVLSAAVSNRVSIEEADADEWRRQLELNVVVPAETARFALPALRRSGGQIVFVNSGAGIRSYPTHTLYSATKFALKAVADGLRGEVRSDGIRIATVYPGPTDTPMLAGDLRKAGRDVDSERYIAPESIASAVRAVVDATPDAQITDLVVRPRDE